MSTKPKEKRETISIEIDKSFLEPIGIDETTDLDIVIKGDSITITPRDKETAAKKKKAFTKKIAKEIMDEYEPVFKKLSKT